MYVRVIGDPIFEETAMKAIRAIWSRRSKIGLVCDNIEITFTRLAAVELEFIVT